MEFVSEEEPIESEDEGVDPYPLEGKYKDEADRREWVGLLDNYLWPELILVQIFVLSFAFAGILVRLP